jgi:hypothetical protein
MFLCSQFFVACEFYIDVPFHYSLFVREFEPVF